MRETENLKYLEQCVISAIFKSADGFLNSQIAGIREDHFETAEQRRQIFALAKEIFDNGGTPDKATILAKAQNKNILSPEIDSCQKINLAAENQNLVFSEFLEELELVRLSQVGEFVKNEASRDGASLRELKGQIEDKMLAVNSGSDRTQLEGLDTVVEDAFAQLKARAFGEGLDGVMLGLKDIDDLTMGFQPGDLVVIAGRTSMGKTMAGLQFAMHNSMIKGMRCSYYSLEMSKQQLMQRMLAWVAKIDLQRIRSGRIADNEWGDLEEAKDRIKKLPIHIADGIYSDITDIVSSVKKTKILHPDLKFVVIDYLQLIRTTGGDGSRNNEISGITKALKALATALEITIITPSQVSRAWAGREKKKRHIELSDLRDSGAIEEDSDTIISVYSYFKDTQDPADDEKGLVRILKQRNGPLGESEIVLRKNIQRFEDKIPF